MKLNMLLVHCLISQLINHIAFFVVTIKTITLLNVTASLRECFLPWFYWGGGAILDKYSLDGFRSKSA